MARIFVGNIGSRKVEVVLLTLVEMEGLKI